jgi:hypothetical protein
MVFWKVMCSLIYYIGINVLEELAAFLYREDKNSRFPQIWYLSTQLQDITSQKTLTYYFFVYLYLNYDIYFRYIEHGHL